MKIFTPISFFKSLIYKIVFLLNFKGSKSFKFKNVFYLLPFLILLFSNTLYSQTNIGGIINDYEAVISINNPGCGTCDTNPACINNIVVNPLGVIN